jgi:hypothetical protein
LIQGSEWTYKTSGDDVHVRVRHDLNRRDGRPFIKGERSLIANGIHPHNGIVENKPIHIDAAILSDRISTQPTRNLCGIKSQAESFADLSGVRVFRCKSRRADEGVCVCRYVLLNATMAHVAPIVTYSIPPYIRVIFFIPNPYVKKTTPWESGGP